MGPQPDVFDLDGGSLYGCGRLFGERAWPEVHEYGMRSSTTEDLHHRIAIDPQVC